MKKELSLEEQVLRSIMEPSRPSVAKSPQREKPETLQPTEVPSVSQLQPGVWEVVQAGDVIRWVSPVIGPAGPATVLARSGQWLLVNKPSHEWAVPIVHEGWDVRRVGHGIEGRPNPKGLEST